jgi:uncharacterized BrkB/YihY/UPF0761 family membrane protein
MNKINENKLNDISRIIVVILIFSVGMFSLFLFYFFQTSDFILKYINKIGENNPQVGLQLLSIFGIIKIVSLLFGIIIIFALIYVLIQRHKNKKVENLNT